MAGLIFKAPYYKPGHKTENGQSRGGLAKYVATRDGVEILRSGMLGYIGERRGSHGMFTDEGEVINLSAVGKEKQFLLHGDEDKFFEMEIFGNLVFFILTFVFSNQSPILKNFE